MSVNPISLLFGAVGALAGGLFNKPKPQPVPMAQPVAQDRTTSALADSFASRRGSLANRLTGPTGAESTAPGQKTKLGT